VTIPGIIFLLIVAVMTALVARRLHIPYTVGLVVVGTAMTLAHIHTGIILTRKLLFDALLPPLLFEAALALSWHELRRDSGIILTLATAGVVISALVVAGGMHKIAYWPWPAALIFGVLIAATDPVSVLATFKETGVTGRLRLLVESESLLNDGVAAVLFALALAYAESGHASGPGPMALSLAWQVGGGLAVGALCGGMATVLAGRSNADHLVETAVTTAAAYGSFLLADKIQASGVLATVAAGMVLGNFGALNRGESPFFTERGREVAEAFWEFAAFVSNSLIFLLIGIGGAHVPFRQVGWFALSLAIALVWLGRAASVYPLCALFAKSKQCVTGRYQNVLFWGGLRGALALALALSLPSSLAYRDEIVITTFGVVAFSVIVQGVAMPLLLRRWDLLPHKEVPK
jgi:CPA1 family monovalent cation:H+ antiporter